MSADLNAIKARLQSREAFRVRGVTTWTSEADEDIAALIQALEEVRDAASGRIPGLKEFDPLEHPGVALHDVLNVLERRMGADWLNGRGESDG